MKNINAELYTDYLICTQGAATATGLSGMLDGMVSHDQITRMLSSQEFTSKDLWQAVKSIVRQVETEDAVLIFDDTIQEKAWTDENELICWHYDHCKNRNVKGINLLNALYYSQNASIPIAFELIKKTLEFLDEKTNKIKRKSTITKNELVRSMIRVCQRNQLKYKYVLFDSWFASTENFSFIRKQGKHFVCALKTNRLATLDADKKTSKLTRIDSLDLPEDQAVLGWLKGYEAPVKLIRLRFTNKDGSTAVLHLACSDLSCDFDEIDAIYQKRWKVEVFHKSLKSNTSLGKSPTKKLRTQSNHVFLSIYAAFKLELLNIKQKLNPFTLSRTLFIKATRMAFDELQRIRVSA